MGFFEGGRKGGGPSKLSLLEAGCCRSAFYSLSSVRERERESFALSDFEKDTSSCTFQRLLVLRGKGGVRGFVSFVANIIELEAERHFFLHNATKKKKKRVLICCTYCAAAAGLRDFPNDDDEGSLERENLGA